MIRLAVAVLILPILWNCAGDDDPGTPAGSPLADVGLSTPTATTLGKVHLTGLPSAGKAGYEDYTALVVADGEDPLSVLVQEDETGPYIRATLHPVTPNAGGDVRIRVTDGVHSSPDLDLRIDPLPEAPGAFERLVATLRAIVAQRAVWAGTSFEALQALDFDEVPASLLPLKTAQSFVDGGGPHDLTSLVANEAEFLSADERELLDRMFGYARLDLVVQADIDDFGAGMATGPLPWSELKAGCIEAGPDIADAQALVDAMVLAALGDAALDPAGAGRYLEAVSYLFTGLGVVPGVGKIFTVAGVGLSVWQAATSAVRGVYPSELTALQYDLDKNVLAEDALEPARWSNVQLTARSTGWTADKSVVNVILTTVGAYVSLRQSTAIAEADALRDIGVADYNARLQDRLDDNDGFIQICPQTWTVDISDPDFSTAGVLNGLFEVDRDAQTVRPLEVGSDVLTIATVPGLFGGHDIHLDKPLETRPILVTVEPSVIRVDEPGDVVQITARIRDAEVTSLYWNAGNGSWNDSVGDDTNDGTTRPLLTPTSRNQYPFEVQVESTSRQGLRASGEPRRYSFVQVRLDSLEIHIAPRDTCIEPGDVVQFRAEGPGLDGYEIVWSKLSGYGSIDQNGLYRSLSGGTSNAKIAAHIAGREDIADSTMIDARGCNCFFQADLGADGGLPVRRWPMWASRPPRPRPWARCT